MNVFEVKVTQNFLLNCENCHLKSCIIKIKKAKKEAQKTFLSGVLMFGLRMRKALISSLMFDSRIA